MKKYKIFVVMFFALLVLGLVGGLTIIIRDVNLETASFDSDGFVVATLDKKSMPVIYTFKSEEAYSYKKYDDKVSFITEGEKVKIDSSSVLHYNDKSIAVLSNGVGLDLNKIDSEIIFYYNIFKKTHINYQEGTYSIRSINDETVTFDKLLLKQKDNKYLFLAEDIRAIFPGDEIVEFGDFVYFEYTNGKVVKIYDGEKYYQTVSDNVKITSQNISIDLNSQIISKDNKKYITLSNLILDKDSNIDLIPEEINELEETKVLTPNVDDKILEGEPIEVPEDNSQVIGGNTESGEVLDENNAQLPTFRVTALSLSSLKVEATIEIEDFDSLLSSATHISIVENSTSSVVYESVAQKGDLITYISYPNLKPDTEYTLFAKASYILNDVEYERTFISKIFRTESLGVSFEKSFVTTSSIVLDLFHESYSNVTAATLGVFDANGNNIDYKTIEFNDENRYEVPFNGLRSNTEYSIRLYDIVSSGVIVDNGYSQTDKIKTLKQAPIIGNLNYGVSKSSSSFELNLESVTDIDHGIVSYKYEVFDSRQNFNTDTPVASITRDNIGPVNVKVDDIKVHRGIAYTYRLIVTFYDNEKTIEYYNYLGNTMQLDGVAFPTLRWEGTYVTHEQINGSIVIEDPSNTIVSDEFVVVYKNSIDMYETKPYTVETGTNSIPIAINELRANETYTFDVYGSLNLQDGNNAADRVYIGSVKVHTLEIKHLRANYTINSNYNDVFSINFRLSDSGEDASFEASTLSSISFTLYQGSTVQGKVEKVRHIIDENTKYYESNIKEDYYDQSAIIDANFFNSGNSDFKSKTYTLVVDEAYDYTGYETNKIPIDNNVFQFQVNNYVPHIPSEHIQIDTKMITNKNAESFDLEYNPELDANTVIGYNLIGSYDNSNKNAVYIDYYVWRYNQNSKEFEKIDKNYRAYFDEDGNLSPLAILVGKGTSYDIVDNDLVRGNTYYFSYEVGVDVDSDGEVDTIYPNDINEEVILKSAEIDLPKQPAKFLMYPSSSNNNSFTWNYQVKDIDNSLYERKLYGFINSNSIFTSQQDIISNDNYGENTYQKAVFTGLTIGNTLTIKKQEMIYKKSLPTFNDVVSQYFYGYLSSIPVSYTATTDNNNLTISISNYNSLIEQFNRVASVDVIIKSSDNEKTFSNVNIEDGVIRIDYYDLQEFLNKEFTTSLVIYFDSGNTGFDVNSTYKVLQNGSYSTFGTYYNLRNGNLSQAPSINYGLSTIDFNLLDKSLTVSNQNSSVRLLLSQDTTGFLYANNNLLLKEIISNKYDNTNVLKFDRIIPGVSLYNSSNKLNISTLLTSATLKTEFVYLNSENTFDGLLYVDLYQTDENGLNAFLAKTYTFNINDIDNRLEFNNLAPKTNYYFELRVKDNENNDQYLYDLDRGITRGKYYFGTLTDAMIDAFNASFVANSYEEKSLNVSYMLSDAVGISRISYKLYKMVNGSYVDLGYEVPDTSSIDIILSTTSSGDAYISYSLDAHPNKDNILNYSSKYKIVIVPYSSYEFDGVTYELEVGNREYEFETPRYEEPFIGISANKRENSLFFRVSVSDPSKIIVNQTYNAFLLDNHNNEIARLDDISIDEINKSFEFGKEEYNLIDGQSYSFKIETRVDYNNLGYEFTNLSSSRNISFGSGIDLGTVTMQENASVARSIDLIFTNAYKIGDIDSLVFDLSSVTTNFHYSVTINDFSIRYNSALEVYYYTINIDDEEFVKNYLYQANMNFYSKGKLIQKLTIDFPYGGLDAEA